MFLDVEFWVQYYRNGEPRGLPWWLSSEEVAAEMAELDLGEATAIVFAATKLEMQNHVYS